MDPSERESLTQWALDHIHHHEAEADRYRQVLAALTEPEPGPGPIRMPTSPWSVVVGFGPDDIVLGSRQRQVLDVLYSATTPLQTRSVDEKIRSPQEPNTHQALHKLKERGAVKMVSEYPQRWELAPQWRQWMDGQQRSA
jgi:hypothetical protein